MQMTLDIAVFAFGGQSVLIFLCYIGFILSLSRAKRE
jgi:hypothetical protein